MPKSASMEAISTGTSSYLATPVSAPLNASNENLKRSSKSTAAVKRTSILDRPVDNLSGELSDLKYGSATSDEIPILTKKRLASIRSNRNHTTSIHNRPSHERLRSFSTKDKTPKSMGEGITGQFLQNVSQNLDESSPNQVRKNKPNFLRDNLADITDFDSITYPVEVPVPHEPHTFWFVENAEDLKELAVKARAERNKRTERSIALYPIQYARRNSLLNPTRIQLDQIQQQFADSLFFVQGTTQYSRATPLSELETAHIENLSNTFLTDFRKARARFESGLRDIGVLLKEEEENDHIAVDSSGMFGQLPRSENNAGNGQLQPSRASNSPSLHAEQEGVSELRAAIVIDLQDGYESYDTE